MKHVFLAMIAWVAMLAGASAQSDGWRFLRASDDTDGNPVAMVGSKGSTLSLVAFGCGDWGLLFKPNPGRIPPDMLTETVKFGLTSDGTKIWSYTDWSFDNAPIVQLRIDEGNPAWKKWIDIMARANRTVTLALSGDSGDFEVEFSAKGSSAAIAAAREARCSPGKADAQAPDAASADRVVDGPVDGNWARFSYSGDGMPFAGVSEGDGAEFSLYCQSPGLYQVSYSFAEGDVDPALRGSNKVAIGFEDAGGKAITLAGSAPGSGSGKLYYSGDLPEGSKPWGLIRYSDGGDLKVFLRVLGRQDRFNERTFTLHGARDILASYAEQCSRGIG
jgi:hypothetical protein